MISIKTDPLTLDLVKSHIRVYIPDDDDLIKTYISASASYVTNYTSKACVEYEVEEQYKTWERLITLEWGTRVKTATIDYTDTVGVVVSKSVIVSKDNTIEEILPDDYNGLSITVKFTPYLNISEFEIYNQARLYIIADWHENRETNVTGTQVRELPRGTQSLLDIVRVQRV